MYDLLLILSDDTVIFKLKLNNKSKACYKDKTVLLAYALEVNGQDIYFIYMCTIYLFIYLYVNTPTVGRIA